MALHTKVCSVVWWLVGASYWTKMALKKVLGRSRATLAVLQTLIVEVEAILNDRPLKYVSHELNDLEPLTPSQLLHGHCIVSLPHEQVRPTFGDYSEVNQRTRLQAALLSRFWSCWRHEYLTSLREHHRASGNDAQQIKQGDIVLVHDDSPRISWKLAVVDELLQGNDGLVRAANIRTAQVRTNFSIARLIPLDVSSNSVSNDSAFVRDVSTQSTTNSDPSSNATREVGRPKRRAAECGRDKVRNWIKELSPPPPLKMSWTNLA